MFLRPLLQNCVSLRHLSLTVPSNEAVALLALCKTFHQSNLKSISLNFLPNPTAPAGEAPVRAVIDFLSYRATWLNTFHFGSDVGFDGASLRKLLAPPTSWKPTSLSLTVRPIFTDVTLDSLPLEHMHSLALNVLGQRMDGLTVRGPQRAIARMGDKLRWFVMVEVCDEDHRAWHAALHDPPRIAIYVSRTVA